MTNRLHAILLPLAVIAILAVTLITGILVPIYSDEVAVHLSHARFFYDNFLLTGLFPQCGESWLRGARWYEYPAIVINSIVYPTTTPVFLRLAGIVFAFVNFGLIWFVCSRLAAQRTTQLWLCAFAFSICALGPLPYVMVLIRPEQILLLCLSLFIILAVFFPISSRDSIQSKFYKLFSLVLLTSVFYFAHPKAAFFSPCVLACVYFFTRAASLKLRIASITFFAAVTAQVVLVSKNVTQCLEAPGIPKMLAEHLNNFATWDMSFLAFIDRMSTHLQFAVERITSRFLFQSGYQSEWLPMLVGEKLNLPALLVNNFVEIIMIPFFYVSMLLIIGITVRQFVLKGDVRRHVISLGILMAIVANAVVYSVDAWSFYTPGLAVPAFLLALLLVAPECLTLLQGGVRYLNIAVVTICLIAILSMLTLLYTMVPKLYNAARSGEPIYSNQLISTPVFMSDKTYSTLESLLQQCEIPMEGASRVAVDGVGYGFLKNMRNPIDILYVAPMGYGMDIKDLGIYLSEKDSDGILSRCDYLPVFLQERAIKIDGMCCLSRGLLTQ